MTKKIRVGILFGGRSGEHDVSLQSAASVINALDPAKYEIVPIGITREGHWRVGSGAMQPPAAGPGERRTRYAFRGSHGPQAPAADALGSGPRIRGPRSTSSFPSSTAPSAKTARCRDLLELADIPYVGAGVLASAAGMDKDVMKRLFRDAGLPVVPWELVLRADWEKNPAAVRKRIEKRLRYPLFVKPVNLGSSVGISKVHRRRELAAAMDLAAQYDRKILVEKGIDAREIECSVLGNDHPAGFRAGGSRAGQRVL